MSKFTSLVQLINSLSKTERKKISTGLSISDSRADYVCLYKIIEKNQLNAPEKMKELFFQDCPSAAFNTAVIHLFDKLLTNLTQLRTNQDSFYSLFDLLLKAKVLFEKSIFQECFQLLEKVQSEAIHFENFSILLIAQKMELDYLLILDFPNLDEKELLAKQYRINDTLKKIRKINEHASLYELLKHRILHKGTARSSKQKQDYNDLVVSEMSIESSFGFENFEIQKKPQAISIKLPDECRRL